MEHKAAETAAAEQQRAGILPDSYIARLAEQGAICAEEPLDADQIQPASLDLRLGARAYRLRASFLPGAGNTVAEKLEALKLHEIDLRQGAVLETGCVYLVPLLESLNLPADIAAAANPKSSTGRLDIFTRIIADGSREFDKIPLAYRGPLYVEISPRSFPILARRGSRLSQLRFARGGRPALGAAALRALQAEFALAACAGAPDIRESGLALSVDLAGGAAGGESGGALPRAFGGAAEQGALIGCRAKHYSGVVDIDKKAAFAAEEFWEPLYNRGGRSLILDPNAFYILASREAVHVPPLYAAEMTPFDPLVGEFRVHYAGFFDPGFGAAQAGGRGARAVLEVRSHEVPFILEHGQIIGRLRYAPLIAAPKKLYGAGSRSHYQAQGLKLSKHFR